MQWCGHDRHCWIWQVVAQLAQDLQQTTYRGTESKRLQLTKCLCQKSTGGLHQMSWCTKSLLTQQHKIEALAEMTYAKEIKLHTVVTSWCLVMAPNVTEVHTATIFRIELGVFSFHLAL
jgi:hypothetical protein